MMKKFVLVLSDKNKTLLLGSELSKICIMRCVIYLYGCIGTGKSVFCRGFIKALGYIHHVKSPTYTLVESYFLSGRYIYHIDCYRLRSEKELMCIDLRDDIDEKSIFLIEWPPNKGLNFLPDPDVAITFNYGDTDQIRHVTIEPATDFGLSIVTNLLCTKKFQYAIEM